MLVMKITKWVSFVCLFTFIRRQLQQLQYSVQQVYNKYDRDRQRVQIEKHH